MPGATYTSTVSSILKEIYQGQIRDQLQSEVIGLKRIEGTNRGVESTVGGKYVTFPIRVSRNQGIGYRNESEALPSAGNQGYASVRVGLKYGYGRVRITGQVMNLAKTNTQAFANAMDKEMNGLKNDIQKDSARIFYGVPIPSAAGKTGAIAVGTATGSTTTLVSTTGAGVMYAQVGMDIDVYSAGPVTKQNTETTVITAIDPATGTITYSPASTAGAGVGGFITRANSYDKEPIGISTIVNDSGALFNVDPAVQPVWKAVVNHNSGTPRAISEQMMIKMIDDIRLNGAKTSLILTSLGVRRSYFMLLTQQRRYVEMRKFEGGYTGLAFNSGYEVPIVEDVDCPPGNMFFLDESSLTVYRDEDWHWIDDDGNTLKWVTDYDAFEAVLAKYWEIGVDRRNANGVIRDLKSDAIT